MISSIRQWMTAAAIAMAACWLVSCEQRQSEGQTITEADSLLHAAYKERNYERLIQLANDLQTVGQLSDVKADYWRGYAYSRQRKMRLTEINWKRATEQDVETQEDLEYYCKSANRLSSLLLLKNNYESTMEVAMTALEKMDAAAFDQNTDYANLLAVVGSCQLKLGRSDEALADYDRAFRKYQELIKEEPSTSNYTSAIIGLITITENYLAVRKYDEASLWIERMASMLQQYSDYPGADPVFMDKQSARLNLYRASMLVGKGQNADAAIAYREAMTTNYAKTGDGLIEATTYLIAAHRWHEAADNFRILDDQISRYGMLLSFDFIQQYYAPKFEANVGAARKDSAIAVASKIVEALDSAIAWQKQNDAAELATMYDTQQKEAQIVQQQSALDRERMFSTLVALILLTVIFVVYFWISRRAQHRLAIAHEKLEDAHSKLQTAYGQLEATTKAKERIESELRIARNIQQSMLPNIFPDTAGVDLFGSMTPAKEVGGDLYDYLLTGQKLYICLGDVSGKGVPAALFMAQAIRMFRALAKQGLMPADIATQLNDELVIGNDNGMFVTMFIGLIDLPTGHLDYCNAGHNPPVFDTAFMEMESNAPIGLWEGLDYVGEQIASIKGKPLFIYSDGLNEAENNQQDQFGDDHLLSIVQEVHDASARQIIETMDAEVERHRAGANPNDDLTMLCVRIG